MAPITPKHSHYNYLCIGGGSAGVASARRAAKHGATALVIEGNRLGGTCVNVGCVPKKIMWEASEMAKRLREAKSYGFDVDSSAAKTFDWMAFKKKRDEYVAKLNGIYAKNMTNENVDFVFGWAKFIDNHTVEVALRDPIEGASTKRYTADHILIAAGGTPMIPSGIPGADLGITSNGFFELKNQPKKVAIVGAGYVGVEFTGMFHSLGSETHFFIRGETVLRKFDPIIQSTITDFYIKNGVHLHKKTKTFAKVEKLHNGQLKIFFEDENGPDQTLVVDCLIWSIGRHPLSKTLNLDTVGIKTDERGLVITNEYHTTNVSNIHSCGDIVGKVELTPVAIAAGRRLSNRLFGGPKFSHDKLNFNNIPSVVFAHPEVGSIGLSEPEAKKKFGEGNLKIYNSSFSSIYYAPLDPKDPTVYKLICTGKEEKVVGLHIVGDHSAEILQGFGAAIKMGATKADFDNVVAIHPTSAEEIVTMT